MTNSPLSIYYVKIRAVLLPILLLLLLGTISLWKVLGEKLEGYQKADFRRTSSLAIAASPYASVTLELTNVLKYRNYLTVIECEHFERMLKKKQLNKKIMDNYLLFFSHHTLWFITVSGVILITSVIFWFKKRRAVSHLINILLIMLLGFSLRYAMNTKPPENWIKQLPPKQQGLAMVEIAKTQSPLSIWEYAGIQN